MTHKALILKDLRDQMTRVSRKHGQLDRHAAGEVLGFDLDVVDDALPWAGLPLGAVHEVTAPQGRDLVAATGFMLGWLGRLVHQRCRPLLWCLTRAQLAEMGRPYSPGVNRFGLIAGDMLFACAGNQEELLWVLEEAVASRAVAGVVGMADPSLSETRRLALVAQETGCPVWLMRPPRCQIGGVRAPSAALTRWEVGPASSQIFPSAKGGPARLLGRDCWQVQLDRCRGAMPKHWIVEWDDAAHCFSVPAALADRPAAPIVGRAAPGGWQSEATRLAEAV